MLGHNKDMHRFGSAGPRPGRCCSRSETPGLRDGGRPFVPPPTFRPSDSKSQGSLKCFAFVDSLQAFMTPG